MRRGYCHLQLLTLEDRLTPADYYVDAFNGSDTNPGTLAQPWRTYLNVVSNYPSLLPPGHVDLQPGDTVYFREGVYDLTYRFGTESPPSILGFHLFNVRGTAAAPIKLRSYPGERAVFSPRIPPDPVGNVKHLVGAVLLGLCEWIVVDGLEVANTYGSGIRVENNSRHIEIKNCYIHDIDGEAANNLSGISTLDVNTGLSIHDNLIHDVYERAQGPKENNRGILLFGENTDGARVFGNKVIGTVVAGQAARGNGIWVKHFNPTLGATIQIFDNIVRSTFNGGLGGQTSGMMIHNNLILGTEFGPSFSPSGMNGSIFERNTIVNGRSLQVRSNDLPTDPVGPIQFRNNVIRHTGTLNSDEAVTYIRGYGSQTEYNQLVGGGNLYFDNNVYFDPNAPVRFNLFGNGNVQGGAILDLAGWQARGYDLNSVVTDPQFDADFVAANPLAADAGWLSGPTPSLRAFIDRDAIAQTAGAAATHITLYRNFNLNQPLMVELASSDASEATVAPVAVFPAGVRVIRVPVNAVNDGIDPRTRAVQIRASANGLSAGDWVRVAQTGGVPRVASVVVTGALPQRSRVTSLTVTFSTQVVFAGNVADAFTVSRIGGAAVGGFTAAAAEVNGLTVVTLSGFAGAETDFGSLVDGRYTVTVRASQVSANGQALDGNGDGIGGDDYTLAGTVANGLYRLFGDANGDGIVNAADFSRFRPAFGASTGQAAYLAWLDFNGDGVINAFDFGQFGNRFGGAVP